MHGTIDAQASASRLRGLRWFRTLAGDFAPAHLARILPTEPGAPGRIRTRTGRELEVERALYALTADAARRALRSGLPPALSLTPRLP